MYKKSPEQERRRKKLQYHVRRAWYDRKRKQWTVYEYSYGDGVTTEVDENGKEWVKKYAVYGTGFKNLKKHGNRKIRYYKGDIKNGGHCFKIYNARWEWW